MLQRIFLSLIMVTVYLTSVSLTQASAPSFNLIESLIEKDMSDSVKRLKSLTLGNYEGTTPIRENDRSIGGIRVQGNDVIISFRGALDEEFLSEFLSCLNNAKPQPLADLGLTGVYGKFASSFNATKDFIYTQVRDYLHEAVNAKKSSRILVEGYSMGSGIAPLIAMHLKKYISEQMGIQPNIGVLTYGSINIFSQDDVPIYHQMIPAANHLSFVAKKDVFCTLFNSEETIVEISSMSMVKALRELFIESAECTYQPIGTKIEIDPEGSDDYQSKVKKKIYTHLNLLEPLQQSNLGNARIALSMTFITLGCVNTLFPVDYWQAHMPEIYEELAPIAFSPIRHH